jgi:DNA-directed RNA polymerase subunit RPC12/RpoP
MAGGLLACSHCKQTIELPCRAKRKVDRTQPVIDLKLGKTTTHQCPHCQQTILSTQTSLRKQACGRCGKPMAQVPEPSSDDMIRFPCSGCNKRLKAPRHASGKRAACRRCGQRVVIPAPASSDCQPFVFST